MKKKRKILYLLSLVSVLCFSVGCFLTITSKVFAEFEIKKDVIYENFQHSDSEIGDIIINDSNINVGEEPFLHIEYNEEKNANTVYSQYLNTKLFDNELGDTVLVLKLRAQNLSLDKVEISFGINEDSSNAKKYYANSPLKNLTKLKDNLNNNLPQFSNEYQEYVIDVSNSFTTEKYNYLNPNLISDILVKNTAFTYFEINVRKTDFVLDIKEIYSVSKVNNELDTTNAIIWNRFVGDLDYTKTANSNSSLTSSIGQICGREIVMNPVSEFEITHKVSATEIVSYKGKYLCIDAEGDVENLMVYISISNSSSLDGNYAEYLEREYQEYILVDKNIFNIKLKYSGESSVVIKEVYLTGYCTDDIVTELPIVLYGDESGGYACLDKFNAEQTVFYTTDINAKLRQSNIFKQTNAEYRYSTTYKSNYVEIKNSVLIFNADSNFNKKDTFNFTAKYKIPSKSYQYFVMKVKMGGLSNLDNLSLCFDESKVKDNSYFKNYKDFYCGYGMKSPLCDENNAYHFSSDYYYLIIDMHESGIKPTEDSIFVSMNYNGQGKIYVDEMFLANTQDTQVVNQINLDSTYNIKFNEANFETTPSITIDLDISNFDQLEFSAKLESNMIGYENNKPSINKLSMVEFVFDETSYTIEQLYNISGLKLSEIFTKDTSVKLARNIKLDLVKCGISNTKTLTVKSNNSGYFALTNLCLVKKVDYQNYEMIENSTKRKINTLNTISGESIDEDNMLGYVYINYDNSTSSKYYILEFLVNFDTFDLSSLVLDFDGTKFYFDNNENLITLLNGVLLKDVKFDEQSQKLCLDLSKMNVTSCSRLSFYGNESLGNIVISDFYFGKPISLYTNVINLSDIANSNEIPADIIEPVITITSSQSVKEGYIKIPITYYDLNTVNINDLIVIIKVTKVKEGTSKVSVETPYIIENESVNFIEGSTQKYACDVCFNASQGSYEISVSVTDKVDNNLSLTKTMKVLEKDIVEPTKDFNWKIVILVSSCIFGVAILVFGVIFLIKYIKGLNTHLSFDSSDKGKKH